MAKFSKYIGLAVAVADGDGGEVRDQGEIANEPAAVKRLLHKLSRDGATLRFCYEAGPCGYELYRQIVAAGHECVVVAPALIPRRPGERIKTDRGDPASLARLDRPGELTAVWVPGTEQEAMRDLSRAREDMKIVERQLRQRLSGFLLRHGRRYGGKQAWSQAFWRWLEGERFETPQQQIVLEEYAEAVRQLEVLEAQLQARLRIGAREVRRNLLLGRPAEQTIDRLIHRLAGHVPQRVVDAGKRHHEHPAPAVHRARAVDSYGRWCVRCSARGRFPRRLEGRCGKNGRRSGEKGAAVGRTFEAV